MTGDKGGVIYDPPPCMNKVAEYFGTIRVKRYTSIMHILIATTNFIKQKIIGSIYIKGDIHNDKIST
jgi:hypothetical protein